MLGRQTLVFNCDEGIDYKSMGRIFTGIVKCGAWGCFDEFNRLEDIVLSSVSQQIQSIQSALKSQQSHVNLLDRNVPLNMNSGIFVTLNPAGKGYGGRQKLPDNLKQLFRAIAMTHPDIELIASTILFSEGFKNASTLGLKVVSVYKLCKELLSAQQHYDWGLRPLKAVLGMAGQLLSAEKGSGILNLEREPIILVKSLIVSTISKLTHSDAQRYILLLKDVFMDVPQELLTNDALSESIRRAYDELGLIFSQDQAEKVVQFYEACRQRMGVVLVGTSGSGKSTVWKILQKALQNMGQDLKTYIVNPKSVDKKTLLGNMDIDTREWADGIITSAARQVVKESNSTHSWIICDGDVDPEWIESLNSVLDDNRLLTMPNGERIQFGLNVNFIFETHDLKYASPATVSRMGMIYLAKDILNDKIFIDSWLFKSNASSSVRDWVNDWVLPILNWTMENGIFLCTMSKLSLLKNILTHCHDSVCKEDFIVKLARSIGMVLEPKCHANLSKKILDLTKISLSSLIGTYYDINLNSIKQYTLKEIPDAVSNSFIETPDVQSISAIVLSWIGAGESFALIGPEGVGKLALLQHCFALSNIQNLITIFCSAQTGSSDVLRRLYSICSTTQTTHGRVLKPKNGGFVVLYLKDLNLPKPDKYGTVELIQFLIQLITYSGFYDTNLEWISIEKIQIVSTMIPSSYPGRHPISLRYLSIIRQCYVSYSDKDQRTSILAIQLENFQKRSLSLTAWKERSKLQKLARTIMEIFDRASIKYNSDIQPHYKFNPRDVSRMLKSLAYYNYTVNSSSFLLDVVINELLHIFADRLVDRKSIMEFHAIVSQVFLHDWNHSFNFQEVKLYKSNSASMLTKISMEEMEVLTKRELHLYERESRKLDINLFGELFSLMTSIERVLIQPGGSLLLAKRPGIPMLELVQFIASWLKMQVHVPLVFRKFTKKAFYSDLKLAVMGAINDTSLLLIDDQHIYDSQVLESINSLLCSGEISDLFSNEELESIYSLIKDEYSTCGFLGTIHEFFISRLKKNLHMAVVLDVCNQTFLSNCQSNPALYSQCEMIWKVDWNYDSETLLAKEMLAKLDMNDEHKSVVAEKILKIHGIQRESGAPPQYLINFLSNYVSIYETIQGHVLKRKSYLEGGVVKLKSSFEYVDALSVSAQSQRHELVHKQNQADLALGEITKSLVCAAEQKKEIERISVQLGIEEEALLGQKEKIELELGDVEPLLRAAQASVGEIRSESLSEIRSLRAPPTAVRDVLEGVLRLMGILDVSWNSMKVFLGQRTVKEEILNFNARNITKTIR